MRKPAYCLQCDDGTLLVDECKDVTLTIDTLCASVAGVSGWHCPVCGDIEITDEPSSRRYSDALAALRVRANEFRRAEIRATRKKLGLKQAEAGRLFGGGINAFSEYERGKTQPHKSTVLLLRLLNKHPELLGEVR